jgi:phospholipid/cholesterol/gamma-HCH transport system permease protein
MNAPAPATPPTSSATLTSGPAGEWRLGGAWTAARLGQVLDEAPPATASTLEGSQISALDSVGAWAMRQWLGRKTQPPALRDWPPRALRLMQQVLTADWQELQQPARPNALARIGQAAVAALRQAAAFLAFIGQVALATLALSRHPRQWRMRTVLHEIQIGGFDALPIIGLTSFLLGVVVAYQGADQLRHYGANVFVVELVGYAMLREFAPLIGAIIIAGRSGSSYAAQIGTMVVTEEVDALRTIGIDPLQRLVLPKFVALAVALPLLTLLADISGVFGGMVMARTQLGIGFSEFASRFGTVMQGSALLIGVGKAFVFAFIIVAVGCFRGLRTQGSADSVGRQTTLSVVQAIFIVIVADALFSIAFNVLDL